LIYLRFFFFSVFYFPKKGFVVSKSSYPFNIFYLVQDRLYLFPTWFAPSIGARSSPALPSFYVIFMFFFFSFFETTRLGDKQPFLQCCLAGPVRADEEYLYSMLASRAATERVIEWIARATPTTETSQIFSVLEGASSVFGTLQQRSEHTIKNVPSLALEEDEAFSQFQRVLTNIAALPIRKLDAAKSSNSTKNERRPKEALTSEKGFGSTTKGPSTTTTNKAPTASKSMITSARDRWMEHMEATAQAQGETVQSLRSDSSLNAYRLDVSEFASQAEEREYQTERAMAQRQQELANKRKQRREDASLQ
jgi:uncharacterized protein YaaR (DUF327 family)